MTNRSWGPTLALPGSGRSLPDGQVCGQHHDVVVLLTELEETHTNFGTRYLEVVLGLSAAAASQITGSLLVFALLVLPPATARRFTLRPGVGMGIAVGLALAITWVGLTLAFYTPWPIGFWVTSVAFGVYVVVHGVHAIAHRGRHRRHEEVLT